MKGKNVNFPAGSKFAAKVVADTDLNVPLDKLAEELDPNKPHGVSITLKCAMWKEMHLPLSNQTINLPTGADAKWDSL